MYILGISCYYHDSAAALLKDGKLVAAALEERFSRKKHDYSFPYNAINFVLQEAGIEPRQLDYAVFYEKPFLKFERIIKQVFSSFPETLPVFRESMSVWLKDKLWIKALIQKTLDISEDRILFSHHHLSHAASAFFPSPFKEAAILTIDGVGEWTTTTIGYGKDHEITLFEEIRFPHSLGLLYSAFTAFLGFKVNNGEYKVMGMAPYGEPVHVDKIKKLIEIEDDGSFRLNLKYFSFHRSTRRTFSKAFTKLFGEPRDPKEAEHLDKYYADIAASIQKVTEEAIIKLAKRVKQRTGSENLVMAGGVALNSKANGLILKETGFSNIYIQPEAGDGGGALGAALMAHAVLTGERPSFVLEHAYWGKEYGNGTIEKFLKDNNIKYEYIENEDKLIERTVDLISSGKVIGWYHGKFEWGPRALGNRSILADPRRAEMKDIVNKKIKFREPFRPFAPSVIEEAAEEFFDLGPNKGQMPLRFMLMVVPVKKDKRVIPAVTHVDGSARVQIVNERINPLYYRLIKTFGEATGIPVVLNTSLNLRGEPIVTSPENAYNTFSKSEMDALIMGNYLVKKEDV